jgi:hypothetical protein
LFRKDDAFLVVMFQLRIGEIALFPFETGVGRGHGETGMDRGSFFGVLKPTIRITMHVYLH